MKKPQQQVPLRQARRRPVLQKQPPARTQQAKTAAAPAVIPEEEITTPTSSRWPHIILLAVGIVLLGGSALLALGGTLLGWEHTILVHINGASLPAWVAADIAKPVSNAVWGILGLLVLFLFIPKYRLMAWQYLVAGGSAYVLVSIVEHIVDRARPAVLSHDIILRAVQGGPGFPSGHVSTLAAICGTLWVFVSWPWRVLLVLFVATEAWARMYLGLHAPLDIIGALGVACVVLGALPLLPLRIRTFFRLRR